MPILRVRDDFAPFVFDEDYDEYIAEMRKDGTWGGNLELQALSLKYECNIIVHHLAAPRYEYGGLRCIF